MAGFSPPPPPPPTEPAAGRKAAAPRSSAAMSCSSRSTCSGLASALTEATRTNVSLSDAILDSSSAMLVTPSAMSLLYSPGNAVPMLGPAAAAAAAGRGRGLDGHALDLDSLGFGNLIDGKLLE